MTILFAVVISAMLSYQTFLQQTERAKNALFQHSVVQLVQADIRQQLLMQPLLLSGQGSVLQVQYNWQNQPGPVTAPQAIEYEPGLGMVIPDPRFRMHKISLTLEYAGRTQNIEYQELTWQP